MDSNSKQFKFLGIIAISIVGFHILRKILPWLYLNFIGPKYMGPRINVRYMGSWAVITGATDGIGKSFAHALAKRGLNIVLISRSLEKLAIVAKEIGETHNVEVRTIAVDFTDGPEIYEKIKTNIQGIDIGVLVNNVGISYPHPEYFLSCSKENSKFLLNIISANIHSVTHMCQLVLPTLVEKKKGLIINISSTAAVIPNPLLTVYSATKAFVDKFSADLHTEYVCDGITVQSLQPGFVATNMTKIRKPSLFAPSSDVYVESAINTIGISNQTAGYFPHSLMQLVIHAISYILGDRFARNIVLKNLLVTRKRALYHLSKKQ